MTDRKIDYNEIFCQAVDTILSKRLESLEYDQTIICRIVDNSDADKGHYIVRYGEAKFHAFSENTKYQIDDNVYVTIPKGDFTRPKLIISKYITNLYPLTKQMPTIDDFSFYDEKNNLYTLQKRQITVDNGVKETVYMFCQKK